MRKKQDVEKARYWQAIGQAGLANEAGESRESAFRIVERAVQTGIYGRESVAAPRWGPSATRRCLSR